MCSARTPLVLLVELLEVKDDEALVKLDHAIRDCFRSGGCDDSDSKRHELVRDQVDDLRLDARGLVDAIEDDDDRTHCHQRCDHTASARISFRGEALEPPRALLSNAICSTLSHGRYSRAMYRNMSPMSG